MIELYEFNYSKKSKKKLEKKMKNNKINNLVIIKESIIIEINKLKESSELEIKFIIILLYAMNMKKIIII